MTLTVPGTEVARRLDAFQAACRRAGLKLTHQRLEIFRELASRDDHPDAEGVFRAVQARMPTVSLDTVYRTLSLLADMGVITPLGPRRESVRFDANLDQHHHYLCTRCGLTRDFTSPALDAVQVPAAVRGMGSVVAVQLEVRGLCASCTAAASSSPPPRQPTRPPNRSPKRRSTR